MKDPENGGSVAERSPHLGSPLRASKLKEQNSCDGAHKTSERRRANGNRPNNPKPHPTGDRRRNQRPRAQAKPKAATRTAPSARRPYKISVL